MEHAGAEPAYATYDDYVRMVQAHAYDENRNKSNNEQHQHAVSAANDMSTRTFPKMKPIEYDPAKMAKEIARARQLGNLPPKEGDENAEEVHQERHRVQAHSFDLRKEQEEVQQAAERSKDVKEAKKVKRQKEKKSKPAPKPDKREKKSKPIPALSPEKAREAHQEPRRDDMSADLANPQAFAPRRKDQLDVDFEKIAMRRAQKQATFRRKEREEEAQWDAAHGGKFSYADEHRPGDKEMLDSEQHRALEAAFRRAEDDHDMRKLMKPKFDDFKLQFVSPREQAQFEDGLSKEEINASQKADTAAGDEIQRSEGKVDFETIARER